MIGQKLPNGIMDEVVLFVRDVITEKMTKSSSQENVSDVKSSTQNMDGVKKRKVKSVQHVTEAIIPKN